MEVYMIVTGIVGSPRKNGNTEIAVSCILKQCEDAGIHTELIRLAGLDIRPCSVCMACVKEEKCSIQDDLMPIYLRLKSTDGIIIGSPVYVGSSPALLRAFLE